jgi:hypothetical protein
MNKHIFSLIVVILLAFIAYKPLFYNGYFPMHDDTQVARVVEMGRALNDGQFPVRWVSDLGYGYGYPIFNFYAPLPYYFGGFFYLMGFNALIATKLMFFLGIIFAGIFMYLFMVNLVGISGGILSALFYVYVPYHAVQLYVRGAIGELWAYAFLPLIMLGLLKLIRNQKNAVIIGGFGFAAVILSHTILGYFSVILYLLILILSVVGLIIKKIKYPIILRMLSLLLFGLSLSAFFWIPAFYEKQYTRIEGFLWDKTDYMDHFVCLGQLWNSPWGFGGSAPGCVDGLSFKLGKLHVILAALSSFILINNRKKIIDSLFIIYSGLGLFIFTSFMMLPVSIGIWQILPLSKYIQYPWRFLTYSAFGLSILSGAIVFVSENKIIRYMIVTGLVTLLIVINGKLFLPQFTYLKNAGDYEKADYLKFQASRISDEYLPPQIIRPQNPNEVVKKPLTAGINFQYQQESETSNYAKYPITTDRQLLITINKAYFPGWRYWVNDTEVKPVLINGFPHIDIPAGYTVVQMRFTNTPVRYMANMISLLAVGIVIIKYGKKSIS